jgi:hypothetical protein
MTFAGQSPKLENRVSGARKLPALSNDSTVGPDAHEDDFRVVLPRGDLRVESRYTPVEGSI